MMSPRTWFGIRFRAIITATKDGVPPWLPAIAAGDDAGLFGPIDAPWVVHADLTTLIGGIRALLVQALHPGSLAGVAEHSRYRTDPLGRLAGTTRWLSVLTFGSMSAIADESRRVNAMHSHVQGEYTRAGGEPSTYRASDPNLLMWVHVAFTDSFLTTFQRYSGKSVDADEYVRLWSASVKPLGLDAAPLSASELRDTMEGYLARNELAVNEVTRDVVHFIKNPPLSRAARIPYAVLFQAAVATLSTEYRQLLGLRTMPAPVVTALARPLLGVMRWLLGHHSPMEEAALARRRRVLGSSQGVASQ